MNLAPVRACYDAVDFFTVALKKASMRRGKPATCHEGCHHCCREPVWTERAEVAAMVDTIVLEKDREELRARTQVWWGTFQQIGGLDMPGPLEKGKSSLNAYRAANLGCPFLVDRRCISYAWRPIGCRLHIAVGPVAYCADDAKRSRQRFMESPEAERTTLLCAHGELCEFAPRALFQYDHLGIWAKELLLGDQTRSRSGQDTLIHSTDP